MSAPQSDVLRYLQRDPLKFVLHLKMLTHHWRRVEAVHVVKDSAEGILLLFPTAVLSYDRQNYADRNVVAMPVADSPRVFMRLLDRVPNTRVVFKLIQDADEALVNARFPGARARVFVNFTTVESTGYEADPAVVIDSALQQGLVAAFGKNAHTVAELNRFFADGAKALYIEEDGQPVSVGMIYPNFGRIWEVAALYTEPPARRKGYSARVARTALSTLQRCGCTPRYVVDEANLPSVELAKALGLKRFTRVIHYSATLRSPR